MLNKLKEFSEQRGYIMIDQWGPSDVREFRSSWNVSPQTAPRRMSMVKAFTDDEIKRMYDACPKYGNSYRHRWKGQDLADFISLSLYTGFANFGCSAVSH